MKELSQREFSKKGGKATKKKYGREHYSKIKKDYWDKKKSNNK